MFLLTVKHVYIEFILCLTNPRPSPRGSKRHKNRQNIVLWCEFNAAWPALPNRSGSAANGQGRYGDQQADFMNTLINTLLNNNNPQYY